MEEYIVVTWNSMCQQMNIPRAERFGSWSRKIRGDLRLIEEALVPWLPFPFGYKFEFRLIHFDPASFYCAWESSER